MGDRTAPWQAPSSGSRSTRTPGVLGQIRGDRRRSETVEARILGRTRGRLRGAGIETVGTETEIAVGIEIVETGTAAAAGGRAETDEETGEGTIVTVDVRGGGAVKEIVSIEPTGTSERRERNEQISKGCREPQPWARQTMGRLRVQAAGTLLEARKPVELSKPLPETVMRNPKAKGISLLQGVASPAR